MGTIKKVIGFDRDHETPIEFMGGGPNPSLGKVKSLGWITSIVFCLLPKPRRYLED